ncbi:EpsI family protein [Stieleria sp. JC731]|uniref:exosortase-associated EpsI family protein n=1 Tax=Pirellulaceae TaxID=2691357 RepID=UPI001E28EF53|nr:exosortase-associated EpsI family protein [Stieleria sp. JC731]MCC9601438.1 EpsI family protein [Stieleria sp. JC731]
MPPTFKSRLPIASVLIATTLLTGIVHGYLDGRWVGRDSRATQVELLSQIPTEFGEWRMVHEGELGETAQSLLRCYGASVRDYKNVTTGATIKMALTFGPRGPIAVHTPDVCYTSQGTKPAAPRSVRSFNTDSGSHRFWSVDFIQNGENVPSLNVIYGWSSGDDFEAADNPRFWMTDDLYKIQIAGDFTDAAVMPSEAFLKAFLPHLEKLTQ